MKVCLLTDARRGASGWRDADVYTGLESEGDQPPACPFLTTGLLCTYYVLVRRP